MDYDIAGLDQCKQGGGDRRHARREGEGVLRLFPKAQPVLQYLLIGAVEAGIDKAFRRSLPLAGDVLEETFACRRAFKDEGRGQEDRRLQRAFGKRGIESSEEHKSEHQSLMRLSSAGFCL